MVDVEETRRRILEATYSCVARDGLDATTLEAAAREAGVSRATVYRHFPGGRDDLLAAVVSWEVGRFFTSLATDAVDAVDFPEWMERTLASARRRLDQHEVLHDVLRTDAGQVLPPLATVIPIVIGLLRQEVAERLTADVSADRFRPGVEVGQAADVLARMMVSFMGSPGSWCLEDPGQVRRLVREHLLAGVLEPV